MVEKRDVGFVHSGQRVAVTPAFTITSTRNATSLIEQPTRRSARSLADWRSISLSFTLNDQIAPIGDWRALF
jgi:hypothetical protein